MSRKNNELKTIKENWNGNHFINGQYSNSDKPDIQLSLLTIFDWKRKKSPWAEEKKADKFKLKVIKNNAFINSKEDGIVWLGHSSFFIRTNGVAILTDPILNDIPFVKRQAGYCCETSELKNIDYIILSHGHRDHFDEGTLKKLFKVNPNVEVLCPLELRYFFEKNKVKVQEAGWYQQYETKKGIDIFFMPAIHWNKRGLTDFNKNLWGSFIIKTEKKTIYFAGDTAVGDHFKEIADFFPNIDVALMPIGAYRPAAIMKNAHISPWEALTLFTDLKAKLFIPMHYGTYDLSDEPFGEPYSVMKEEQKNYNIKILDIGEELSL
jgi:L-ascorbate metabolism protein UlaG (beta-lactamase superfamily)